MDRDLNRKSIVIRVYVEEDYIFKVEDLQEISPTVIKESESLSEFRIKLQEFLNFFLEYSYSVSDNKYQKKNNVLASLVGGYDSSYIIPNFSNVLFVFENINWLTLQGVLLFIGIKLSSGSTSQRHVLSSVQYNLSRFLINLNYSSLDVYRSNIIARHQKRLELKPNDLEQNFLQGLIFHHWNEIIKNYELEIESFNKNISMKENEISSLNGLINAKFKVKPNSTKIVQYKSKIELVKAEIDSINSTIQGLLKQKEEIKDSLPQVKDMSPPWG